jgi:hypothetical protein
LDNLQNSNKEEAPSVSKVDTSQPEEPYYNENKEYEEIVETRQQELDKREKELEQKELDLEERESLFEKNQRKFQKVKLFYSNY